MSMGQRGISFVIGAVDKFSAPLAAFNAKMAESTAGLRLLGSRMGNLGRESGFSRLMGAGAGVSRGFGNVAAEATALGSKVALIGGGLGYGFKKGFIDVASQFEKFETILNTLNMGDTAKSKKEMSWISDFAAKTPYELAEVTEAFVQLRSFGMEPMNGLLQTLGDTSSAMGKPIKQAVEAIADAVTGENERLKEFGIVGKKTGDKIVYAYTNASGAQATMMAKANDRAAIQATLTKIWAEKYGGGMENLSKTFDGMGSNAMDFLSRVSMKIMSNGAFDWMKGKLSGLLEMADRMSADGSLDAWAKQWGEKLTVFLERAWQAGKGFAGALMAIGTGLAWTADLLGGWENLGIAVASLMGLKLVLAVAMLAKSFIVLGAAIMTTPIGWVLAGLTAITIGIMAIWKNWDKIMGWIKEKTPKWILRMFGAGEGGATPAGAGGATGEQQNAGGKRGLQLPALGAPAWAESARPSLGAANVQRQINETRSSYTSSQQSKITVEVKAPKGTEVRQSGAPVDTDVTWDMGPAMAF
ncbi:MAG: tape measure protein [Humidesulfovibrio sp.]